MNKKRQHYVWRKYLRAWAPNDKIWCNRQGKVFHPNLMGVGQEKYFYRISELTTNEISFIKKIAVNSSMGTLRELNSGWINMFTLLYDMKSQFERLGLHQEELEELYNHLEINLEEELHTTIEQTSAKYLDRILKKDVVNSTVHSNTPYYVTKKRSVCNGADGTPWAHCGTESRAVGTMETG